MLTYFTAPPILLVAHKWHLTIHKVFLFLRKHAIVGVIASTLAYYRIFKNEFAVLQSRYDTLA
jgi:hypothetical protein